jgi:uncharacterized protein YbbC (DUF1343 family)
MAFMKNGLDRLADDSKLQARLRGRRIGLLAHPASVTRDLTHAHTVLERIGARPQIIFGPEHGYGGEAQDMIGVHDARDVHGTPVRSLYGATFDKLSPRADDLRGLDLLVIDLQDVGARYYTFVWTAVLCARACATANVAVMILDRPNPIGRDDDAMEGTSQLPRFRSFVGLEPIPIRHALTLGEIVKWRADVENLGEDLVDVVTCEGIDRNAHASDWDRAFVMPSPNMPTYETALVYPGGCLLEGTNLSDGRGTTRPFEITGAPWLDGVALARAFAELNLEGVTLRPLTFFPMFHKHAREICGGVQVHITNPHKFRPVATYLALITLAHHQRRDAFRFRTEAYEFVDDIPAFDLLTGSDRARIAIQEGASARDVIDLCARVTDSDRAIVESARASLV